MIDCLSSLHQKPTEDRLDNKYIIKNWINVIKHEIWYFISIFYSIPFHFNRFTSNTLTFIINSKEPSFHQPIFFFAFNAKPNIVFILNSDKEQPIFFENNIINIIIHRRHYSCHLPKQYEWKKNIESSSTTLFLVHIQDSRHDLHISIFTMLYNTVYSKGMSLT